MAIRGSAAPIGRLVPGLAWALGLVITLSAHAAETTLPAQVPLSSGAPAIRRFDDEREEGALS